MTCRPVFQLEVRLVNQANDLQLYHPVNQRLIQRVLPLVVLRLSQRVVRQQHLVDFRRRNLRRGQQLHFNYKLVCGILHMLLA